MTIEAIIMGKTREKAAPAKTVLHLAAWIDEFHRGLSEISQELAELLRTNQIVDRETANQIAKLNARVTELEIAERNRNGD